MFAAIGRRLSSSGRHRRPPPVAAVVVVDPRLYIFTSILTRRRAQPPCRRHRRSGPGMLHVRRRRVAVVVLAAALWSWSSSSGRGCARRRRLAVFRCWRKPGHRTRQNMRATPALPILHLDSAVSIKTTRSTRILKTSLRRTSKAFLHSAQLPFTSTANSASSRCLTHARRVPRATSSSLSRATVLMAVIALDSLTLSC